MIKKVLYVVLIFGCISLCPVVSVGDTIASSTTFQFSVGSAIYDASKQQLWTLTGQDTSSLSPNIQAYGISYTPFVSVDGNSSLRSYPYISSQAFLTTTDAQGQVASGTELVENPLLGNAFSSVTFLGNFLTVVQSLYPSSIYLIQSVFFDDGALYGTSSYAGYSIVNRLDLQQGFAAQAIAGYGINALFIAQSQGVFGTDASHIAFAGTKTNYVAINGQNTACTVMVPQATQPLTVNTPVLTAGGADVSAIGTSVFMYPSSVTMQMYVGLDVTAGLQLGSNAVALFSAQAQLATPQMQAGLVFNPVIPDVVVAQDLLTPISTNANQRVVVANVTTTQTSTGLSYMITTRSNGVDEQTVYAMPMVTMARNAADNGKIAKFDSIQQTFKIIGTTYRVQGFDTVIDDASEIDIAGSVDVLSRIQVGGGPVPLAQGQTIKQLTAQADAVYITIHEPFGLGSTPGMFKSQALFDVQGRIMAWSAWQRVAGTDDRMLFAIKNRLTDATMYISGANAQTIQQTTWNKTAALTSYIAQVQNALPVSKNGVQGIIPFSNQTPGLSNLSLVIATGYQAVVIAQTGTVDADNNLIINEQQNTVTINSEQNLDIGSVVTTTFAHSSLTDYNWLFFAGDAGLAVLSDDVTGVTFEGQLVTVDQLGVPGMSCKTVGNFKYVKKIIGSGNFVYVLTTTGVYRIALSAAKFRLQEPVDLAVETVFSAASLGSYAGCLDMVIDDTLLLIGTTAGLYALDLASGLPVTPVGIEIPGGLSAVSQLCAIGTGLEINKDFLSRGNLYVLTIDYALQQSRLNRFTIINGQVLPIQDQLLQGQNGPLLIFDGMNNSLFIDGSLGFVTSYRIANIPPAVKYLQYTLQAGRSSTQILLQGHTANISIASILYALGIAGVTRDYASGCLMLGFDYGLLTDSSKNEDIA